MAEFAKAPDPNWSTLPGQSLLMLAGSVVEPKSKARQAARSIEAIALTPSLADDTSFPNRRLRTLQALNSLEYRATAEFWKKQFDRPEGRFYALPVWHGLVHSDIRQARGWLVAHANVPEARRAFLDSVPLMIAQLGTELVSELSLDVFPYCDDKEKRALSRLADRYGLKLQYVAFRRLEQSLEGLNSKDEAEKLIIELGPIINEFGSDLYMLFRDNESRMKNAFPNQYRLFGEALIHEFTSSSKKMSSISSPYLTLLAFRLNASTHHFKPEELLAIATLSEKVGREIIEEVLESIWMRTPVPAGEWRWNIIMDPPYESASKKDYKFFLEQNLRSHSEPLQ